ncbi:MAG: HNH endonuclease [Muribaculaceae bacterium]|nr:HNH endonuclease [Muribaculaceae bacterium]
MAKFSLETIQNVWDKGSVVNGYNPFKWRIDQYGTLICWSYYGDRRSKYGWEIDHIKPISKNGSDCLCNLRPLHWHNNASRQDGCLKRRSLKYIVN